MLAAIATAAIFLRGMRHRSPVAAEGLRLRIDGDRDDFAGEPTASDIAFRY